MAIWQLCANLLIPNCLRSNLSYSPLAALELYVKNTKALDYLYIEPSAIYLMDKGYVDFYRLFHLIHEKECIFRNSGKGQYAF